MNTPQEKIEPTEPENLHDDTSIEDAFQQMEILFKSRCVQAPLGSNITIREIEKEEKPGT